MARKASAIVDALILKRGGPVLRIYGVLVFVVLNKGETLGRPAEWHSNPGRGMPRWSRSKTRTQHTSLATQVLPPFAAVACSVLWSMVPHWFCVLHASTLDDTNQNDDDRDDQERMNESAHGVRADKTQHPKDYQDDCDSLKHDGSPFATEWPVEI